ncbi:MAG TPA: NAD(P)/FAD-dependent oxidoreductase [candidate division Zixibacteria bacterium]|nr:NAD(P)/FAD-dependent oxidoreductase [candidate division Zixibacteria bacterium]
MPSAKPPVIVIGGGAAGLMAAAEAARCGAPVVILEKMTRPGRKLRITGKGRCNLTNIAEKREFISHFGPQGKFLHQAFARFFSDDLVKLMKSFGVTVKTEENGKVFPEGDSATAVVDALVDQAARLGVVTRTNCAVESILSEGESISVQVADGEILPASAVILATGGASYPATGSTGDGYRLAASLGHTIVPTRPALVPLETSGPEAAELQGLSLQDVRATILVDDKRVAHRVGDMLFTHFGVSGPIILSLSLSAVDALAAGQQVKVVIDLQPTLDEASLDACLLRDIQEHGQRQLQTLLKNLLPNRMIPLCCRHTGVSGEKPANQITGEERKRLRRWLKGFMLEIRGHRGYNEATVTAGGVSLKEVNPKTMASKRVPGLFFAGEVLDINGDTGGYNLQAAFSTGWVAGHAAAGAQTVP